MAGGEGVVWALRAGEDLNANLVRFGAGRGVGEHINDEVDVIFVGVSGSGFVEVRYRIPASAYPPPRHPSEKIAKASPSMDEAGHEDACYAGACEPRQHHEREPRLEVLRGAQDFARSADDHD